MVQRRAGVTELWRCRIGQTAELLASQTTAWGGLGDVLPFTMCRNRAGTAQPYIHELDRPFHLVGRALSPTQIERIAHGARANDVDQSGYAGAVLLFASISGATTDAATRWNPTDGTTMTLNGVVVTFVSSLPTGNQVLIGATLADTLTNLNAFLAGSALPALSVATYSVFSIEGVASGIRITHKTAGPSGASYTVSASSANIRVPSSGVLGFVEWEYGALNTTGPQIAVTGGGYLLRQRNADWAVSAADTAPALDAGYVSVGVYDPGLVYQQNNGSATVSVSGVYGGAPPTAIEYRVLDLTNSVVVGTVNTVLGLVAENGAWSGTVTIPKGKRWVALSLRKSGSSTWTDCETPFGVGEVVACSGQSLMAGLTKFPSSVVPNGFCSRFFPLSLASVTDVAVDVGYALDDSWHRQQTSLRTGGGEAALGNVLSEAAGCVVGFFNRSKGGTSITVLGGTADTVAWGTDLAASKTNRIGWFLWTHGHANAGQTDYGANLDLLLSRLRVSLGSTFQFGLLMLTNNTTSNDNANAMHTTRALQKKWIRDKAASDPLVFEVGDMIDLQLSADGIHGADGLAYAREGERFAAAILHRMGVRSTPAQGPRIIRAERTGAVIDVIIAQYGGTQLITSGGGSPSGFDVSANGFTSLLSITSTEIVGPNRVRITLASDPGQEVEIMYLYGRPGKYTAGGVDSGRGLVTQEYTIAQGNILYSGETGFSYSPLGLPVGPLHTPMKTVKPGHVPTSRSLSRSSVVNDFGRALLTTDGRVQLAV